MTKTGRNIPPGPAERYDPGSDLLCWIGAQFDRFGDIYRASIYGTDAYVLRDPHLAEHVLRRNWQNYVKGQAIKRVALLLGSGLMVSEGELWKRQRRMIQPAFSRHAVAGLAQVMIDANAALLAQWEAAARTSRTVDVTADVSGMVLQVMLVAIFGEDFARVAPQFKVLSQEAARNLEFAQAFRALGLVVREVAAERRRRGRLAPDILGLLMEARDRDTGRTMSEIQLVNEIKTLLVAGHETTASTLNWVWYLLSQHPAIEARLGRELDLLPDDQPPALDDLPRFPFTRQVIEEALRLYPAGWLLTRRALKDDRLGEYFVPAGTEIYIPPYFIQRHPGLWRDPDRFDPDRFAPDAAPERHELATLPFSVGPRNCIGEHFARIEMQLHVMMIARRLRLRYSEISPPEFDVGVNLRSKHNFLMAPELRTKLGSATWSVNEQPRPDGARREASERRKRKADPVMPDAQHLAE